MTTATVTVLFCDVVASTGHRARLGEVAADRVFRSVEHRFRQVIAECGGRVLKSAGDGVMAMFGSASEAVAGAIALHRENHDTTPELELRVGVAAGDVSWEGEDCFGMPVVVAARLESACEPGGILVSAIVRHLAGNRVQAEYETVGALDLKGVPEPVDAFAVSWRVSEPDSVQWAFPSALPSRNPHPMVGRAADLAVLTDAWSAVYGGDHAVVVLAGEAGAGKTRLATELARQCHREGAIVLAGVCDAELSLPYQPWVMVLDQLISQLPATTVEVLRSELADLLVLVPDLEHVVGALPPARRLDPEAERLRMFAATASVFEAASATAPVLVVVDDLHWAGSQTLDLLRYLVKTRPVPSMLLVATMRDADDEVGDALVKLLAELRRMGTAVHHEVGGMDGDAVLELLGGAGLDGPARARADAIAARTRGNAFLVTELLRHGSDDADSIPDSVMDVVKVRLLALGDDAREVADLVAVAGRLELAVLVEAARERAIDVTGALGELTRSDLVQEVGGPAPAYQFAHALIRDAIVANLSGIDAAALHHVLALAIEQVHTADRRPVLPELARHFVAAASLAGWQKAAYYGRRAAAQARRTAAYEQAVELIESSLAVTPAGTEERARLLLDVVDLLERVGRGAEAVELAEDADDIAFEIADPVLQARACIELERASHLANAHLERSLPRLRRVLASSTHLPEDVRIQATASLGRACWLNGVDDASALIDEAVRAARQLGDEATLSHALEVACVFERDPGVALELARELGTLTQGLGKIFQSMWAMTRETDALLTLGRLSEAETVLLRLNAAADRYRFTSYRYLARVFSHTLALAAASFDRAEQAAEAANTAEQVEFAGLDASGAYGMQMFMVRRAQGRLEEMRPVLSLLAGDRSSAGIWRPGLILAYAELGMHAEAHSAYDELMVDGLTSLPRDTLWPLTLMFLADAGVALERLDAAPILLDELDPFAGLTIRAGYTTNGGPADRCRAAMAELAGQHRYADRCIADAHRLATTSGSPLWVATTEQTWAWMLVRRGDRDGAEAHRAQAARLAARYDIGGIAEVDRDRAGVDGTPTRQPDDLTEREVEVLVELANGCTNREIADRLFISPNTAANHVRAILRKTRSANRTEAAAYAFRERLVGPPDAGSAVRR